MANRYRRFMGVAVLEIFLVLLVVLARSLAFADASGEALQKLPAHTHNSKDIHGVLTNAQLPDIITRDSEWKKHTHVAEDIVGGRIAVKQLDKNLVVRQELDNALAAKADSDHNHKNLYADKEAFAAMQQEVLRLQATVNSLVGLLNGVTREQGTIVFNGVNVQITNGSGTTDGAVNGRGNLIVGYNETRGPDGAVARSGSHNVIVGSKHSYSSYGGVATGSYHTIAAPYASVNGGYGNEATGSYATVSGGQLNKAIGKFSSISGGMTRIVEGSNNWQGGDNFSAH